MNQYGISPEYIVSEKNLRKAIKTFQRAIPQSIEFESAFLKHQAANYIDDCQKDLGFTTVSYEFSKSDINAVKKCIKEKIEWPLNRFGGKAYNAHDNRQPFFISNDKFI